MRLRLPLCLAAAALAALLAPSAALALDRSLVLRGRALDRDGTPLAGARISARGSATLTATTDAQGRYMLRVVIGSPASLERAPFTLEVRAEYDGRRLPFTIQGAAFALDVSLVRGESKRVRVRSNAPSAALAVAAAFVTATATEAVVEAEFGGAGPGGAPRLSAVEEVPVSDPAAGRTPAAPAPRTTPEPAVTPAPARPATGVTPAPAVPSAARAADLRAAAVRDSLRRAERVAASRRQRARADSLARVRAASRPARVTPPPVRPGVTTPLAPVAAAAARQTDTLRTVQLVVEVDSLAASAPAPPPRVQRIDPFAAPPAPAEPDSCACRLRGTVEVAWDRPLEQDLPVDILLSGPATQQTRVELFIGSPREFRLGPLPCGVYQLELRPAGRLRYGLARGDGRIECRGAAQVRVVLTPVGR